MAGNTVASIEGLGGAITTASAGPPALAEERALNRSVAAAVRTVNETQYLGSDRAVTFAVDHRTRLPIIRVVDTSTNHIIEQWPPEYLLQMAADAKKLTRDSR